MTSPKKTSSDLLHIGKRNEVPTMLLLKQPKPMETFPMPPSSVLDRVKGFLPSLAQANEKLQSSIETMGHDAVDIENIGETDQHIEMNLALVEHSASDSEPESSSEDEESDAESDGSDLMGEVTEETLKLSSKSKKSKAKIEVLEETDSP